MSPEQIYQQGFEDGIIAYAHIKNGITYVGTVGRLQSEALKRVKETWNYKPPVKDNA